MRRFRRWALLALAGSALACGASSAPDPVEGDWTPGSYVIVRVGPCAGAPERLCGIVTAWPADPAGRPELDSRNRNPRLTGRTLIGMPMFYGFRRTGAGRWTGGKIYNPDDGRTYDAKLRAGANGTLIVQGCLLFFCGSRTWKRP